MRQTSLDMVYELAKQDKRVFFLGSDLGHGVLDKFKKEMPERFLMEGISEAHIVGMAAGMAMEGKIVYVNTIATFLTRRCFEQIALDLCLHKTKVRLIASGGGLVYAPLGPTHLAIEDIAILRVLPNMSILAPADAREMKRLMPMTLDLPGPVYIRVAKGGDPVVTSETSALVWGKAVPMRQGEDALLVTTGIGLQLCLEAAEKLKSAGISMSVLHLPIIKPFDSETVLDFVDKARAVVTVEEHVIAGGLGSMVAEVMAEANLVGSKRFKRIGIPDKFPDKYGSQSALLDVCGVSVSSIVDSVQSLLR